MKLKQLLKIQKELTRFSKELKLGIKAARDEGGYISSYSGCRMGEHNIGGTRLSGSIKRKYIDMKYEINKLI